MSDSYESIQREQEAVQRQAGQFQEVAGESEAEAMRSAFLQRASREPGDMAAALSGADGSTRAGILARLQREQGNGYVQRVVSEARGTPGRLVGAGQSEMVDEVVQRKGPGSPLPDGARGSLEGFFGADFSGVRVHDDATAQSLSSEVDARAFTTGSDIFFGPGQYAPGTTEGQGLLAHELTHVVQQTGFTPKAAGGGAGVQREGAPEEEEMQRMAVQREAAPEEEEVQRMAVQREAAPEEEEVQRMAVQRETAGPEGEDEEI